MNATVLISSPRERCMLDMLQRLTNLHSPNSVLDLSQTLGRNGLRSDGLVPALGTGCSRLFATGLSSFLSAEQCLMLQGHDAMSMPRGSLAGFSREELFVLAGNSMCMPVVGVVVASAMSLLTPQ